MLDFMPSTSLGHMVNVTAECQPYALFCVGNLALLNKVHCSYGKVVFNVFRCFRIGRFAQFSKKFIKIADFLHFLK